MCGPHVSELIEKAVPIYVIGKSVLILAKCSHAFWNGTTFGEWIRMPLCLAEADSFIIYKRQDWNENQQMSPDKSLTWQTACMDQTF